MTDSWNKKSDDDSDLPAIDAETGDILLETPKPKANSTRVFKMFAMVLPELDQRHWIKSKTIRDSANRLFENKGKQQIGEMLILYKTHQDDKYMSPITSPYDLEMKWEKLLNYKKRNNL